MFDAILEQRKSVDLQTLHVNAHVLGMLLVMLFHKRFCTQTIRTLADNITFFVAECEKHNTHLNCFSLQSLEAQNKVHRTLVYRITNHKHSHNTLATVLTASEEAKRLKESSQEVPHFLAAAQCFAARASASKELPKAFLSEALTNAIEAVATSDTVANAKKRGLSLIEVQEAGHFRWWDRDCIFFCEFMSLLLGSLRIRVTGNDSLSASIRSLRNEAKFFKEIGAESVAPNVAHSIGRGRVTRVKTDREASQYGGAPAGGESRVAGGGAIGGASGGVEENKTDTDSDQADEDGEDKSDCDSDKADEDTEDKSDRDDASDTGSDHGDGRSEDDKEESDASDGEGEAEAQAAARIRKMTALSQLPTHKEAPRINQNMSSMSWGTLCVGTRMQGDQFGTSPKHHACIEDTAPVSLSFQWLHDLWHSAVKIGVLGPGAEFLLHLHLSSVQAMQVKPLPDNRGFVFGIDLAHAPAVTRRDEGGKRWKKLAMGEEFAQSLMNLCAEGPLASDSTPLRTAPRIVLESPDVAAMDLIAAALRHAAHMSRMEDAQGNGEQHFQSHLLHQPAKSFMREEAEAPRSTPGADPLATAIVKCTFGDCAMLAQIRKDVEALLGRPQSDFIVTCTTCKRDFRVMDLHGVKEVCTDFVDPALGQVVLNAGGPNVHGTVTDFDPVDRMHTISLSGADTVRLVSADELKSLVDANSVELELKLKEELNRRYACPVAGCDRRVLHKLPVLSRHITKLHPDFQVTEMDEDDPLHLALRAHEMKGSKKRKSSAPPGAAPDASLVVSLESTILKKGTEVEIRADNEDGQEEWWKAKITRVPTGSSIKEGRGKDEVKIHYLCSHVSMDEWITLSSERVRLPQDWGKVWEEQAEARGGSGGGA